MYAFQVGDSCYCLRPFMPCTILSILTDGTETVYTVALEDGARVNVGPECLI